MASAFDQFPLPLAVADPIDVPPRNSSTVLLGSEDPETVSVVSLVISSLLLVPV